MRIENLLGHNQYGYIANKLDNPGVAWYFAETTANHFDKKLPFNSSFSHLIFKNDTGPVSDLFELVFPILLTAMDKQEKTLKELIRIRMGLITRTPYKVVHAPHNFDGDHYHSSSAPTNSEKRITLTFNFTTTDDK